MNSFEILPICWKESSSVPVNNVTSSLECVTAAYVCADNFENEGIFNDSTRIIKYAATHVL